MTLSTAAFFKIIEPSDAGCVPPCVAINKTTVERCGNHPARKTYDLAIKDSSIICQALHEERPIDESLLQLCRYCLCRGGMNGVGKTHQDQASRVAAKWKDKLVEYGFTYLKHTDAARLADPTAQAGIEPRAEALHESRVTASPSLSGFRDLISWLVNTSFRRESERTRRERSAQIPMRPTQSNSQGRSQVEHGTHASSDKHVPQLFVAIIVARVYLFKIINSQSSESFFGKLCSIASGFLGASCSVVKSLYAKFGKWCFSKNQ